MMKKSISRLALTGLCGAALLFAAACQQTDVIGNGSVASFQKVADVLSDNIQADEANAGWALTAPDGSARFIWSSDYSRSPLYDVSLEFDAQPFIDAGLDVSKLPDGMVSGDKIIVGTNLGEDILTYDGDPTPVASYEKLVRLKRGSIKYHAALGHYGVDLTGGNAFEWAKDMDANDKDIVFALNPEPFIDAGVDPDSIEGWVFAKVPAMDEKGNEIEVDKILKPFDLNE